VTDPLLPDLDEGPVLAHERGFRRELIGLLLLLAGVITVVYGAWQFDWRFGVVVLGALIATGGLVLGIEGS
jgi:uncharacterized membrane protein YidH (DUF202 family)